MNKRVEKNGGKEGEKESEQSPKENIRGESGEEVNERGFMIENFSVKIKSRAKGLADSEINAFIGIPVGLEETGKTEKEDKNKEKGERPKGRGRFRFFFRELDESDWHDEKNKC